MSMKLSLLFILTIALLLAGCSPLPAPTSLPPSPSAASLPASPTPLPSPTLPPTPMPTRVASAAPRPSATSPAASLALPIPLTPMALPGEKALNEWRGFPILPGALAGQEYEQSYVFTTHTWPSSVKRFYKNEMTELGWSVEVRHDGTNYLLLLGRGEEFASIAITLHPDQVTLVILSKLE